MNETIRMVAGIAIISFGVAISAVLTFGTVYFVKNRDLRAACSGGILALLCWAVTILNIATLAL